MEIETAVRDDEPIILFDNVFKSFGDFQVLKGISLSIAAGERVVICGPSGSGKSTLIRCINGLETYDTGRIRVAGLALGTDDASRRAVRAR